MELSGQVPRDRAWEQDATPVAAFLEDQCPRIHRLAAKMGAEIGDEDDAGVNLQTRSGRTGGAVGHPPEVAASDQRGGYHVLSIITATGEFSDALNEQTINGKRYVEFLQPVLEGRTRPLMIMADQAPFHRSEEVSPLVRAHRPPIRMFFLPAHSPEMNPEEPVWNDLKHRQLGQQPIKNKIDLKNRIHTILKALQNQAEQIRSFFQLPDTKYAAIPESAT